MPRSLPTLPVPVTPAPARAATHGPALCAARRRWLGAFFAPRTIAIIGASEKTMSVGRALMENLYEFNGSVFPVNPRHGSILGVPAFSSIRDVPEVVDLAVIATPAKAVPGVIRECVEAGITAAIIHSAGFKECGREGAELEQQVLREARRGSLRLLGPNCLGLMAPHHGLNATFAATIARPGSVAFISQSGALCTAVLDWSLRENVGLSAMVSVGSMVDVGWADLITSLGDDPHTRSILIYMEAVGDARAFLSAAREVAFSKPIIVVKAGRTETGSRAAASHTGALTGSDAVLDAAFRRVGVLRVEGIEDLFDMAEVLAKQPRPRGPRLGIVTNAGGPAVLAVDRLVLGGGQAAPLSAQTIRTLDAVLPAQWSHGNPVDVLGDADEQRYAHAITALADDPSTDALLVILTPQAMTDALAVAAAVKASARRTAAKPIFASWMGAAAVAAGRDALNQGGIPTFEFPERAVQAFDYMWRYSVNLDALYETPTLREGGTFGADVPPPAGEVIERVRRAGRVLLTEQESKALLASYGISTVGAFLAASEEEAAALAAKIGFPVAIKLHSETITHKAKVGGVCLNVRDLAEARAAWRSIEHAVTTNVGRAHFQGVSVQRMIQSEGVELILGSSVDPQFGPVVLFGAGGKWVEVLPDRAIGLPPLNSTLARRLMEQTRIFAALRPGSGRPPIDLAALEDVVVRFSQLVAELRAIKEIDVNPLLVSPEAILALDARVILQDAALSEPQLPRLAIRPYPQQYSTAYTLADGTAVRVRSIRPEDEPMMVRFHGTLSDESVYFRYFTPMTLEQRTCHARLARLCFIDYDREVALVAVQRELLGGANAIMGVARLCKPHGAGDAEFAVLVSDRWQRRGVGTLLLRKLLEVARDEHVSRIRGVILRENHAMRRLCQRVGFDVHQQPDAADYEAVWHHAFKP